jgi:hypothetical protein
LYFVFTLPLRVSIPRPHGLRPCCGDLFFTFLLLRVIRSGLRVEFAGPPTFRTVSLLKNSHFHIFATRLYLLRVEFAGPPTFRTVALLEHSHFHFYATLLSLWRLFAPPALLLARGCHIILQYLSDALVRHYGRHAAQRSGSPSLR